MTVRLTCLGKWLNTNCLDTRIHEPQGMGGPRSKAEEEVDDFASSGLFSLLQRVSRKSKQTLADVM